MSAADPTQDSVALAERIAAIAADKKAIDIRVIDLRGIVSYTDFFVIASGNTERQAKSIHDAIYEELVHGVVLPRTRSRVVSIIEELWDAGAGGVLLGCTELELLVKQADVELPVFPCTTLHVQAALDAALD